MLYNLDETIFRSFIYDSDFSGRRSRVICSGNDMREAVKIDENIFIEVNLNANSTLNYIKLMMDKYSMNSEDLRYWIK